MSYILSNKLARVNFSRFYTWTILQSIKHNRIPITCVLCACFTLLEIPNDITAPTEQHLINKDFQICFPKTTNIMNNSISTMNSKFHINRVSYWSSELLPLLLEIDICSPLSVLLYEDCLFFDLLLAAGPLTYLQKVYQIPPTTEFTFLTTPVNFCVFFSLHFFTLSDLQVLKLQWSGWNKSWVNIQQIEDLFLVLFSLYYLLAVWFRVSCSSCCAFPLFYFSCCFLFPYLYL